MGLMERNLSSDDANLVDAVCFSSSSLLPKSTKEELEKGGLIHIVTASGLQVLALSFLLGAGFKLLPLPKTARIVLLATLLAMYALASGLNPAIVRAVGMAIVGLGAFWV